MRLTRKYKRTLNGLVLSVDTALLVAAFALAYVIRDRWHSFYFLDLVPNVDVMARGIAPWSRHFWLLLLLIPIWEGVLVWSKMFKPFRTAGYVDTVWTVVASVFLGAGLFGAFASALRLSFMSRGLIAIFVGLSTAFLVLEKCAFVYVFRWLRLHNRNLTYVLVVGTGPRATAFVEQMVDRPEWGMHIVGLVDKDPDRVGDTVADHEIIGGFDDIPQILDDTVIDHVVFVIPRLWLSDIEESVRLCEERGVEVKIAIDQMHHHINGGTDHNIQMFPVLVLESSPIQPLQSTIKQCVDIALSVVLFIMLTPVFLAVGTVTLIRVITTIIRNLARRKQVHYGTGDSKLS